MLPHRIILITVACGAMVFAQGQSSSSRRNHSNSTDTGKTAFSSQDRNFLDHSARDGEAEIEMGKLGVQKASASSAKSFAQRVIDDHTKANQQLETLAKGKDISVRRYERESEPKSSSESPSFKAEYAKLSAMSGAAFDRAFLVNQIQDHRKAINAFEQEQRATTDPDIRNFIDMTLPVLRDHLNAAEKVQRSEPAVKG